MTGAGRARQGAPRASVWRSAHQPRPSPAWLALAWDVPGASHMRSTPPLLVIALVLLAPAPPLSAGDPAGPPPLPRACLAHLRQGAWAARLRKVVDERRRTWLEVREDHVVAVRPEEVVLERRSWSTRPWGLWRTTGREVLPRERVSLEELLSGALGGLGLPRVLRLDSTDEAVWRGERRFACRRHEVGLRQAWLEDWTGPARSVPGAITVWLDASLPVPAPLALRGQVTTQVRAGELLTLRVDEELVGLGDEHGLRWGRSAAALLREAGIDPR